MAHRKTTTRPFDWIPTVWLALASSIVIPAVAQQPLAGQDSPEILQLVIERIVPGLEADYDAIEKQLAAACERRCPNAYVALESFVTPKEIYWITAYRAAADVQRIEALYAADPALLTQLGELSKTKRGLLLEAPTTTFLEHREDVSDGSPWLIGILPYAVIVESDEAVSSGGAVFESDTGLRLVFAPAANAEDANAVAAALGPGAKAFVVRAAWSKPAAAWIIANPALWSSR
jgi:hypothetical protein